MNTYNETLNELSESIDHAAFCELVDAGVDPGQAWDEVSTSTFDIVADVEADPYVEINELV